jgi:hypothetical protein
VLSRRIAHEILPQYGHPQVWLSAIRGLVFPLEKGFRDLDPVVRDSQVKPFVDTFHTSPLPFLERLEPWDMPSEQSR